MAAALALLDSVLHLALPLLPATERTVKWAERLVVRPELQQSFRWLAVASGILPDVEPGIEDGLSVRGRDEDTEATLRTLIEHVELATLQRELAGWEVDDAVWREAVLSPSITLVAASRQSAANHGREEWRRSAETPLRQRGASEDLRWRRMLWQHLYPRVRRESNPVALAEVVARELALRMWVRDTATPSASIRQSWMDGETDRSGFERLYVAALRSVGVPARLGGGGCTEVHAGAGWQIAPRPFSEALAVERMQEP